MNDGRKTILIPVNPTPMDPCPLRPNVKDFNYMYACSVCGVTVYSFYYLVDIDPRCPEHPASEE